MLREIGSIRQDSDKGQRRWFQDDYFDLFLWQDATGVPIAFQLCYERTRAEGVIRWSRSEGYAHARVDSGEQAQKLGMAPLLRADGKPPYYRIFNRFLDASHGWEPALAQFLLERLRDYRRVVFGSRRKPRRRVGRGRRLRGNAGRVDSP